MKDHAYPDLKDVPVATALQALADPVRLSIVRKLLTINGGELTCGDFCDEVSKATISHHIRVLREAGLIQQRTEGTKSMTSLRLKEFEARFPGLLKLVRAEEG